MLKRSAENVNAETLILETFVDATYFEAPCLPGRRLFLDLPYVEEEESIAVYAGAFTNFLELTPEDLLKVTPYAFAMFKQFEDNVDPSCLDVEVEREEGIWAEITIEGVNLVRDQAARGIVYVVIGVECSWDPEHGMQFVFRNGNELTRVSEQDGHYSTQDTPGLPANRDS